MEDVRRHDLESRILIDFFAASMELKMKVCGVYGFEVSKPIEFSKFQIVPRYSIASTVAKIAKSRDRYNLTAVLLADDLSDQDIFEVASALTFIEHSEVIVTSPHTVNSNDYFNTFADALELPGRSFRGGSVIGDDLFHPGSRERFLRCLFNKLKDQEFLNDTGFDFMYYKCVESCRLGRNILDIIYFLLFSGLESYSRTKLNMADEKNSAVPIAKILQMYDFDFKVNYPSDLQRSVSSYAHLRNGLFHRSAQEATINQNGTLVNYKIFDYWSTLSSLVPLIIMKAIQFDDGHINWDRWRTRIAYSRPSV